MKLAPPTQIAYQGEMKLFPSPIAILAGSVILAMTLPVSAVTEATTTPVGFTTLTVPGGGSVSAPTNTTISVPLYNTPDFSGVVASVTSPDLITLTGANFSVTPSPVFADVANPRLVRVTASATAAHVGKFFLVTTNTTNQLTVTGVADVTAVVSAGDSCEVLPANTLKTLFGDTLANATSVFVGYPAVQATDWFFTGASAGAADNLLIWDPAATPQPTWVTFYNNGTNWKKSGNLGNQNNTIIYPDDGMFVVRRGSTALSLTLKGTVPSTAEQTDLAGAGSTFISNRFPVDMQLVQTGIQLTTGWVTGASANAIPTPDKVFIWDPAASPVPTWGIYYHNGTIWKRSGNLSSQDAKLIPVGTAVFITKSSAASTLTQALPYVP